MDFNATPPSLPLAAWQAHRRALLQAFGAVSLGSMLPGCAQIPSLPATPGTTTDEATAYALGKQAYVYGYPLIYFARIRYQRMMVGDPVTKQQHRWGAWMHRQMAVTPDVVGAPQTDTLYSNVWLDLSQGPYLITIPKTDGRYWSIQCCDLFGTTFGLPSRRSVREATVIALVGPDWNGSLPKEVTQVYRSAMRQTFNLMRMFFASPDDLKRAIELQQGFVIKPLQHYAGKMDWQGLPGKVFKPLAPAEDPLADFKALQQMWQECPPPDADRALTSRFAAIGLEAGVSNFDHLPEAARRGLQRAEAESRAAVIQMTRSFPGTKTANGWTMPRASIGTYEDKDYLYRATTALLGTVATPVYENIYVLLQAEPGTTQRLSGSKRYELRIPKALMPQVQAFWSIHAYTDQYTVIANPANKYAISDRTAGLKLDADGGLTLHVQAEPPTADRQANWLPLAAGKPFMLIVRGYEPEGALKDLSWAGPEVKVLE